jgi:hypothetical protein
METRDENARQLRANKRKYIILLNRLRRNEANGHIEIPSESFFEHILQRIDNFSTAVVEASNVTKLIIGYTGYLHTDSTRTRLMSRQKSVAVSKFCRAVGNIEGLHTLALGGFGTNHAITSQLFPSLSNIQIILLDLPWRGEIQREFGLLIFTSYIKASLSEP